MSDDPKQEKEIFIDEDWKSQAQAEKEALERRHAEEAAHKTDEKTTQGGSEPPWPQPTLSFLATTLGTQAMVALGLIPGPGSEKPEIHLAQAKHFIDTIQLLMDKTEGNRDAEETRLMDGLLHDLRMSYLAVQQNPPGAAANPDSRPQNNG